MNRNRDSEKQQKMECDVLVAGGGIAGVMAAAAAAKCGAKTILLESSPFLGGVVTMGPLEALMTPEDSEKTIIAGIGKEFLDLLKSFDEKAVPTPDTTGYCASIVPYDAEAMKYALTEFLYRYQVKVLMQTMLEEVKMENDAIIGVTALTRTGSLEIACRAVVDATGNGYAAYLGGNVIISGDENGKNQPVTMLGRAGNVDIPLLKTYVKAHPEDFKTFGKTIDFEANFLHLWGFRGALREGYETKRLSLLRNEIHMMQTTRPGEVIINYTRVNADPWKEAELSGSQMSCMRQFNELIQWFRETIPAFRNARIVQTGYIGVRESGRIKGKYIMTKEDIVSARHGDTDVGMGAFPIDIHRLDNGMECERILAGYHIPWECLMAESLENCFAAGRCVSSDFGANASLRISMTCMSTGHAAGVMAAVYAKDKTEFSYGKVAGILKEQGAIL